MILNLIAAIAAAYQVFAILACLLRPKPSGTQAAPGPVSVLKPVRGLDPGFRDAIRSHTCLTGEYEFLCGVGDPADPARAVLAEFPKARVIDCPTQAPNGKVGVLIDLAAAARYSILVVNDSDIRVDPDYLARVTAPLADPGVGLVTCLYRPVGDTFAARFEGLGIATVFAPAALVARLVGVDEFAMGSTLAFRQADLERIGGFPAIAHYLADDYQLGHRIHALGLKCVLSDVVVETYMGGGWKHVWAHQVRWARTIRVSNPGGYLGLPVTNAALWALVAAIFGRWDLAAILLIIRITMAFTAGWVVIGSRDALRLLWAVPARDLYGFGVWLAGLFGKTVVWRDRRLQLNSDGTLR